MANFFSSLPAATPASRIIIPQRRSGDTRNQNDSGPTRLSRLGDQISLVVASRTLIQLRSVRNQIDSGRVYCWMQSPACSSRSEGDQPVFGSGCGQNYSAKRGGTRSGQPPPAMPAHCPVCIARTFTGSVNVAQNSCYSAGTISGEQAQPFFIMLLLFFIIQKSIKQVFQDFFEQ